jgi:hypothetical protein
MHFAIKMIVYEDIITFAHWIHEELRNHCTAFYQNEHYETCISGSQDSKVRAVI